MKHHNQKQLGKERVYFSVLIHITVHHWRKSGQEPRAWTNVEAREKCGLPACSSGLCQPASCRTQTTSSRVTTAHSDLGPPTLLINQENIPRPIQQVDLVREFSIKGPSNKITLLCIKLMEKLVSTGGVCFLYYLEPLSRLWGWQLDTI